MIQEEHDKIPAEANENNKAQDRREKAVVQLDPHGAYHALPIVLAEELGGEDAGSGDTAEDRQVVVHEQLIDDAYAAHLVGAESTYHKIIQKTHKTGDALLDDNGNNQHQYGTVKVAVADVAPG